MVLCQGQIVPYAGLGTGWRAREPARHRYGGGIEGTRVAVVYRSTASNKARWWERFVQHLSYMLMLT